MPPMRHIALAACLGAFQGATAAADQAVSGVFEGTGRACSGTLKIQKKNLEWRSAFSSCHSTPYEVLERSHGIDQDRVVLHLKKLNDRCRYSVIEMERRGRYQWNVTAYSSLKEFNNRKLPDWSNSSLPERQTLSCPMVGPH
ncbi:hypothetical protein [Paracidovorax avenae]|uniref:hypothetical protein n=2 Tax=Comamonadaceae TaxID=80864 RepID=UPI001AD8084B|nr:hypothetical protein [Paracidovorax avenae]